MYAAALLSAALASLSGIKKRLFHQLKPLNLLSETRKTDPEPAKAVAYYLAPSRNSKYYRERPANPRVPTEEAPVIFESKLNLSTNESAIGTPHPYFAPEYHRVHLMPRAHMLLRTPFQQLVDYYDRMEAIEQGKAWNQMLICQPPCRLVAIRFDKAFSKT